MKNFNLIILLIAPIFAFSQANSITNKEKKAIDAFTNSMCECVNEVMNVLDENMLKYLDEFATNGETAASEYLANFMQTATSKESQSLLDSSNYMQTEEFGLKFDVCDDKSTLSNKSSDEIDNLKGVAYDYFIRSMSNNSVCKISKSLFELGNTDN